MWGRGQSLAARAALRDLAALLARYHPPEGEQGRAMITAPVPLTSGKPPGNVGRVR
ncbi:MAG TPA: hypothetical protein VH257_18915 [Chloroflexota bacterium]|nr:hypothetical protein [Chloroflexota bacterium]